MESLRLFFTHFTDYSITASLGILGLMGVGIIALWFYNRKKLHQLSHQIPASVVKHYLDSIIQNSQSLKSSLFRGGGLDITEGIPSVVPVSGLSAGTSPDDVNRKIAEISSLTARLMEKERMIGDLEKRLVAKPTVGGSDQSEQVAILKSEVERLQKELAKASAASPASSGGGDSTQIKKELADVTRERDELKERLLEYEIIEEDLANLKRLQQENEQLKAALGKSPGAPPAAKKAAAAAAPAPVEEVTEEIADEVAEEMVEEAAPEEATAMEEPEVEEAPVAAMDDQSDGDGTTEAPPAAAEGDQKSAEELLSEFEKMLG